MSFRVPFNDKPHQEALVLGQWLTDGGEVLHTFESILWTPPGGTPIRILCHTVQGKGHEDSWWVKKDGEDAMVEWIAGSDGRARRALDRLQQKTLAV